MSPHQQGQGREDRRRSERTNLHLKLSARERGRTATPATLATFSAHGCLLTDGFFSTSEHAVWVKLPGLESQPGQIAWTDGRIAGIAFSQPLHPAVVANFARLAVPFARQQVAVPAGGTSAVTQLPASRRAQILGGYADPAAAILQRKKSIGASSLSAMVSRSTPRRCEHRREERHPGLADGHRLSVAIGDRTVAVDNMSSSGIKTALQLDEGVGDMVPVSFAGFASMEGRIIWIKGGHVGIELPPGAIELTPAAN